MRKSSKLIMCILLVIAMVMQLTSVSFAAVNTTVIGAVSYTYDAETKTYTASVSARGLDKKAMLVIAEYKEDGTVNAEMSKTADNATDGVLTASVEVSDEANDVKAFVWNEEYTPFNMDTVLGHEFTADDIEIYLGGVEFSEAVGEALELDAEYDYTLPVGEGDFKLPKITFAFNDNTIDADVKTDADAMQTVITFEAGERIETAVLDTNTSTNSETGVTSYYKATRYEYSKPWVHTVTINWLLPESGYISNDKLAKRSGVNGLRGGDVYVGYDYVMEYTLPEGAEYGTVSFKADSFANQMSIIVVEPLEKDTKGTDAIVKADGSAVTWLTDTGIVAGYDYTLTGDDRINEPWDSSRVTWGEYSVDTSVVITGATSDGGAQTTFQTGTNSASTHYRVARKLQESDGYFVSGARISEGQRDPSYQKIQYTEVPDSLKGYNYITNYGTAQYDLTVSMTVNQDVKLHLISNGTGNGVTTLNSDGTDNEAISATTLATADRFRRYYQNTVVFDALSAAYFVANNGMDESIFLKTGTVTQSVTSGDVTYKYPNDVYVVRNWAQAYEIMNTNGYGWYILPECVEAIGLETTTADDGTVTVTKKSISEYASLWKGVDGIEPLISTPEIVTGHTYNGVAVDYYSALRPVIREFNGADTNKSIFSDRAGTEQPRHTGMIVSYPEVFDLEDSAFITTAVKYGDGGEGNKTYYNMYGNIAKLADYEPYSMYSFTVSKDAEVLIFTNGNSHAYLDDADNGWTSSALTEGIRYVHVSNAVAEDAAESTSKNHLNKVYRKIFAPGDTVTMYTPGNTNTVFVPFIKAIDVEHTSDAADITIDGATIEGFDADVKTYTYTFSDVTAVSLPEVEVTPADPSTTVELTYNKSFEAPSAKAVLTTIDGKETVYTINFINSGAAEVTNLYLCTEGNVIPAEYLAEGTTEDVVANDLPSYVKNGFGLDMSIWADRSYKVTELMDESLAGKDVIRSCVAWWNAASNPEHIAFKTNAENSKYIPWVNFKTTRDATVMVFKTTSNHSAAFTEYGFVQASSTNGYFAIVRDGNSRNLSSYMFSKDVEAGELVTVPNDTEPSNSYTIIIKYADYK